MGLGNATCWKRQVWGEIMLLLIQCRFIRGYYKYVEIVYCVEKSLLDTDKKVTPYQIIPQ